MAHEPTTPSHRVRPAAAPSQPSYDALVVIGLVAVIAGAASGSLPVALAVFSIPALALGGALFLRSHL